MHVDCVILESASSQAYGLVKLMVYLALLHTANATDIHGFISPLRYRPKRPQNTSRFDGI